MLGAECTCKTAIKNSDWDKLLPAECYSLCATSLSDLTQIAYKSLHSIRRLSNEIDGMTIGIRKLNTLKTCIFDGIHKLSIGIFRAKV